MSLANKYPCALVSLFLTGCAADAEPELERADPEKREACAERAESQAFDQAADVSVTGSLLYAGQSLWSVPMDLSSSSGVGHGGTLDQRQGLGVQKCRQHGRKILSSAL